MNCLLIFLQYTFGPKTLIKINKCFNRSNSDSAKTLKILNHFRRHFNNILHIKSYANKV